MASEMKKDVDGLRNNEREQIAEWVDSQTMLERLKHLNTRAMIYKKLAEEDIRHEIEVVRITQQGSILLTECAARDFADIDKRIAKIEEEIDNV